ncbi:MAG: NAD-dependent dehydratase, partial [Methylococcales bacterium]
MRQLPLDWFILQPSIVYGDGAQSTALLHALAALPVQLLPDGGTQTLQPIHLDDVVAAVCQCLEHTTPARQTLALVGANPISYADLLKNLRRRLG